MCQHQICPSNAKISHMCKLFDVHHWGKDVNMYAKYEFVAINHVVINAVYKCQIITMMPQPDFMAELATWPSQPKKEYMVVCLVIISCSPGINWCEHFLTYSYQINMEIAAPLYMGELPSNCSEFQSADLALLACQEPYLPSYMLSRMYLLLPWLKFVSYLQVEWTVPTPNLSTGYTQYLCMY